MMSEAREWRIDEPNGVWILVAGDDHPTYWLNVEPGQYIITGREIVEIDTDVEESAYKVVPYTNDWREGEEVWEGAYRVYDEELYSCIQPHTTQSDWTPPVVPALWRHWPKKLPGEDYPPWVQPLGGHDAYALGDRVTHNGQNWESTINANVWEPGSVGAEALWTVI